MSQSNISFFSNSKITQYIVYRKNEVNKMENKTYRVTVTASTKELTAREKIALKNFGSYAIPLDQFLDENGEKATIPVVDYITLHIENSKSENPEYDVYLIVSDNATYYTSSNSLHDSIVDIIEELKSANDTEPWSIAVSKKESKNYKGKKFITCTLV